ncbi:MAG: M23 family metallopeptidase [Bacteroidota bacterium]|nr:M23 family metallopeptidase [Bacteroidota bacterium]
MMYQHFCKILITVLFLPHSIIFGQSNFPQNYFRSPFDIPMYLSGNFGELRSTHFHTGIDIKTQGVEGHSIYAIADAYVSRIKVQAEGYGYALYLTHPNGYVSVYGHLQKFAPNIADYVIDNQYKKQSYKLNLFPSSEMFPVKKGQIIGLSGNSGSSSGPHLHFEIRDAQNSHPLNPLLFGFDIKDNIPPRIYSITLYPINNYSFIERVNKSFLFSVDNKELKKDTIEAFGEIGFGIRANDFLNGSHNKCGIYILELFVNERIIYSYKMKELDFSELRYVQSHYDYQYKTKKNRYIQKSFVAPNNSLSNYTTVENNGIVLIKSDSVYSIKYVLYDAYQNKKSIAFFVKGVEPIGIDTIVKLSEYTRAMPCMLKNKFTTNDIELIIPKKALYDDLFFNYSVDDPVSGLYSKVHHIHEDIVPLQKSYSLRIKAEGLPDSLQSKALAVWVVGERNNYNIYNAGGEFKDGFIETSLSNFGNLGISVDTIPPNIRAINISENKNMGNQKTIKFKITDDLSGIKDYEGFINDKWVLFRYDAKKNLIYYEFADNKIFKNTNHKLTLTVVDNKDNQSEYTVNFKW